MEEVRMAQTEEEMKRITGGNNFKPIEKEGK